MYIFHSDFFCTGVWSTKAAKEASKYLKVNHVYPKPEKYNGIPDQSSWNLDPEAAYVYYCDNETVNGKNSYKIQLIFIYFFKIKLVRTTYFHTIRVDKYGYEGMWS